MKKTQIRRHELHCTKGTSDKLYVIWIFVIGGEFVVWAEWGRRTGSMKTQEKYRGSSAPQTDRVFQNLYGSKLRKGYVLISNEGVSACSWLEGNSQASEDLTKRIEGEWEEKKSKKKIGRKDAFWS